MRPSRVTAFGGGHGLYSSLTALRPHVGDLTAVVVVSDDGGSSGRLRDELHVPPPGDLRMALSALCEETEWGHLWRDILQHRFSTEGALDGHTVGNLLIASLWNRTGDIIEGLDWVARLLRAEGKVLPLAGEALEIRAEVESDGRIRTVVGQVAVATAVGRIERVWLDPPQPRVPTETVSAVTDADAVVLGPGSWYSSVLPHFLIEPVADALVQAGPKSIVTLNIAHEDDETIGMGRADDIAALRTVVPGFVPAIVIVDETHADDDGLLESIEGWGSAPLVRDLRLSGTVDRHDPQALGAAYRDSFHRILGG
jgi:uncharacterized cofD-like protein